LRVARKRAGFRGGRSEKNTTPLFQKKPAETRLELARDAANHGKPLIEFIPQ
jgi:hypothetical protein